jgi:hypothetical protein
MSAGFSAGYFVEGRSRKMQLFKKSEEKLEEKPELPEKLRYSRYYEHDGALRAYANRAMLLAYICVPTAFIAVALAAYVRLQPPTVIRVDSSGQAVQVAAKNATTPISVAQGAGTAPTDFEKAAFVRLFLQRYLSFSPDSVSRNWADALNMMTANLRRATLATLERDNIVGKIQEEQITSVFQFRSLEPSKDDPLAFTAFGVKEVHRVRDHQETTDKLVGEVHIRLITERRSEENPSGLLVADYGERLIESERKDAIGENIVSK